MKYFLISVILGLASISVSFAQQGGFTEGNGSWYHDPGSPGLFASHATFPFGTQLRITNLSTNQQVMVQVGGRIPNDPRWIIDISTEAAHTIGMNERGFTRVRVEEIPRENKPRVLRSTSSNMRKFFQNGRADLWPEGTNLVAGHPSLAIGTKLRITNRSTGRKVDVSVANRIRASQNRIVSISRTTAERIGINFDRTGNSPVEITIETIE